MSPPFRVDHVGSLIRPKSLVEARNHHNPGPGVYHNEISAAQASEIHTLTNECIREVLQQQLKHDITTITDGEFGRGIFWDGLFDSLEGFETKQSRLDSGEWREGFPINEMMKALNYEARTAKIATGKIKRGKSYYMDDWLRLRNYLPGGRWGDGKITIISPHWWLEMMKKPYESTVYADDANYLADIAVALREEIMDLYNAGLRNIQIDDPLLSMFYTESWEPILRENGVDIEKLIDTFITSDNIFLKDLPQDLNVSHHMCRGNVPGVPTLVGGYNKLLEKLFTQSAYRVFCLEWDSPEHGDFSPLQYLPKDKVAMLGILTTKDATLEDPEYLKKRVFEAADVITAAQGRTREDVLNQNLGLTTQCGFATMSDKTGIGMSIDRQWEKMGILQKVAEDIWPGWRQQTPSKL